MQLLSYQAAIEYYKQEDKLANQISYPEITTKRFVDFSSRYINSKVLYYGDNNKLTFSTYKRKPIPASSNDKFVLINSSTEYRPDLVSYAAYGTVDYWWYIMEFNGIKDIYEFKSGLTLRVPTTL